jgi:hypothetical protein
MTTSPSVTAAAYMLGVDPEALARFVDHHNPLPGQEKELSPESVHAVGNEMAIALEMVNPTLAQRWRLVNYLSRRSSK